MKKTNENNGFLQSMINVYSMLIVFNGLGLVYYLFNLSKIIDFFGLQVGIIPLIFVIIQILVLYNLAILNKLNSNPMVSDPTSEE